MKCVISAFKFKSCLHKNIFSLKTTLSKKLSAQDCKFTGIRYESNVYLSPPNAMYRFKQKLITQFILCFKLKYMSVSAI